MPQVHITLGLGVEDDLGIELIKEMGETLILIVEQFFKIEGKNDVAFTAISAIATKNEAPIQVEIRYTAGKDEYEWGKPFDPSEGDQLLLANRIIYANKHLTTGKFKTSVWCKSHHKSVFKMEE